MNKEEFNALDVSKQVEYINEELKKSKSITGICKEIGVGRSTVRDRFAKQNYVYSKGLNTYIKDENNGCITTVKKENNSNNTSVIDDRDKVTEIINKSDINLKNNLIGLANDYEILKEIIEIHRRNTSVVNRQIVIDLEESDSKLATLRINSKVLDMFNNFCNENKQFKKVDLLSQALKDFVEVHI